MHNVASTLYNVRPLMYIKAPTLCIVASTLYNVVPTMYIKAREMFSVARVLRYVPIVVCYKRVVHCIVPRPLHCATAPIYSVILPINYAVTSKFTVSFTFSILQYPKYKVKYVYLWDEEVRGFGECLFF